MANRIPQSRGVFSKIPRRISVAELCRGGPVGEAARASVKWKRNAATIARIRKKPSPVRMYNAVSRARNRIQLMLRSFYDSLCEVKEAGRRWVQEHRDIEIIRLPRLAAFPQIVEHQPGY